MEKCVCVCSLLEDYLQAVEGVKKHLLKQTGPSRMTFVGEMSQNRFNPKMVRSKHTHTHGLYTHGLYTHTAS